MYIQKTSAYIKPSFGTLDFKAYEYVDYKGNVRKSQCTTAKRNDLNYENTADIIIKNFEKYDKVKIMPMNVSDGTEIYFLSDSIIKKIGFKNFKEHFSPIIASDIYAPVIKSYPKNGIIFLEDAEAAILKENSANLINKVNVKDYITHILNPSDINNKKLYKLNPEFQECFKFQILDFQERLKLLRDKGNTVVMIRNSLYHSFGENEASNIVKNVANKLVKNSLFIIGGYDRMKMPDKFVKTLKIYFDEIDLNVFRKKAIVNNPSKYSIINILRNSI